MEIESNSKEPDQFLNIKEKKMTEEKNKREKKVELKRRIKIQIIFGMQSMTMAIDSNANNTITVLSLACVILAYMQHFYID